jgi:hypothetical protein
MIKLNSYFAALLVTLAGASFVFFLQKSILTYTDEVEANSTTLQYLSQEESQSRRVKQNTSPTSMSCGSPIAGVCMPDKAHQRGS